MIKFSISINRTLFCNLNQKRRFETKFCLRAKNMSLENM